MADRLFLTILAGSVVAVPAPKALVDALISAEVHISDAGQSGFRLQFTLSNNSPLQTFFLLAAGAPIPVMRVILTVTVGAIPKVLIDGVVTHQQISPDVMRGRSTLTVRGEDLTDLMDRTDATGTEFGGASPDVRVTTILDKYAVFGIASDVMPMLYSDNPLPAEMIPGQDGTDLDYINLLAEEAGYVFYIEPGPLPGQSRAYWGPQIKFGVPQAALNVNMDAWTNVESLEFTYEPRNAVQPLGSIQDAASMADVPLAIPPVSPFNPPLAAVIAAAQTTERLDNIANLPPGVATLRGIARTTTTADVVTGEGTLDVLRYGQILNTRQLVGVRGAGLSFDGLHYVEKTTHQLKLGEYKQSFTLRRNGIVSNLPALPVEPF
jgi:hypothetical protein